MIRPLASRIVQTNMSVDTLHGRWLELFKKYVDNDGSFYQELHTRSGCSTDMLLESVYECAMASQSVRESDGKLEFMSPLHSAAHDSTQLRWQRTDSTGKMLPNCANADMCAALSLRHNQGPLQMCLSPSEQEEFEKTGAVPQGNGLCLLCIRETCESTSLARRHSVACSAHTQLSSFLIAPGFHNAVGCAGGYDASCIGSGPACGSGYVTQGNIVGSCRSKLRVLMDPATRTFYVDQSQLFWSPSPQDF